MKALYCKRKENKCAKRGHRDLKKKIVQQEEQTYSAQQKQGVRACAQERERERERER